MINYAHVTSITHLTHWFCSHHHLRHHHHHHHCQVHIRWSSATGSIKLVPHGVCFWQSEQRWWNSFSLLTGWWDGLLTLLWGRRLTGWGASGWLGGGTPGLLGRGIRSGERGGGRGLIESSKLELGDMDSDAGWLFVKEVCLLLCEEAESPLAVVITWLEILMMLPDFFVFPFSFFASFFNVGALFSFSVMI